MEIAPVILFVYDRPDHTRRVLESLHNNKLADQTELIVHVDGLKPNATEEQKMRREMLVRYIKSTQWCGKVEVRLAEYNKGLSESIVKGVNAVLEKYDRVIVLEDDMVCDRYFLQFMNEALEMYSKEDSVACISGYVYPLKREMKEPFFLKGADCWGWATWKRAWKLYRSDGRALLNEIQQKELEREFNFNNTYNYIGMLKDQIEGKNDSWAVRWYASAFLSDKLCFYPPRSLVRNIGNDSSGKHSQTTDKFDVQLWNQPLHFSKTYPRPNDDAFMAFSEFFTFAFPKMEENTFRKIYAQIPLRIRKWIYKKRNPPSKPVDQVTWSGDYRSWKEVSAKSSGYDSKLILEKVLKAALAVKNGKANYERDGVLFNDERFNRELVGFLNDYHQGHSGELAIIDFGGSLGSTYMQSRKHIKSDRIHWTVVEQKMFVEAGNKDLANEELKFFENIKDALQYHPAQVFLLSSVLPYIQEPYRLLQEIINHGTEVIIVDRTPFLEGERDRLTLQKVPESIYNASYPAWFFNEEKMIGFFEKEYRLVSKFESNISPPYILDGCWLHQMT